VLDARARSRGTPDELALLATSRGEARYLNLRARSRLRAAGRLAGPSITAGLEGPRDTVTIIRSDPAFTAARERPSDGRPYAVVRGLCCVTLTLEGT